MRTAKFRRGNVYIHQHITLILATVRKWVAVRIKAYNKKAYRTAGGAETLARPRACQRANSAY